MKMQGLPFHIAAAHSTLFVTRLCTFVCGKVLLLLLLLLLLGAIIKT